MTFPSIDHIKELYKIYGMTPKADVTITNGSACPIGMLLIEKYGVAVAEKLVEDSDDVAELAHKELGLDEKLAGDFIAAFDDHKAIGTLGAEYRAALGL